MRKSLPYLGAALSALALAWSAPVQAQGQFKDLDEKHWAYAAVRELQDKQILVGYPDDYFKGKRYLTRYEFAIALKRALDKVGSGTKGEKGDAGEKGEKGDKGDAGEKGEPGAINAEDLDKLKRLTDEFAGELKSLGANIRDINSRLDAMSKDLGDLRSRIDAMPKIGGQFFLGARTDRSRFAFIDKSGAARPNSSSHFSRADVVHDLHVTIDAKLKDNIKFTGDVVASNYLSYRGNTLSAIAAANPAITPGGAPAYTEIGSIYQAQLDIPLNGVGRDSNLTVGRYKMHLTPLTYYRPDLDQYFDVPAYDDGNFVQDGIRFKSKFGSLNAQLWLGSFATVVGTTGGAFNQPLVGGGIAFLPGLGNGSLGNVAGINFGGTGITANQVAGVRFTIPTFNVGDLGVTLATFSTNQTGPIGNPNTPFTNVVLYGVDYKLRPFGRFNVNLEAAKTVTGLGIDRGDGQFNEDNNAFHASIGWGSGPIAVKAGYLYIDPRFGAPGSWLTIGNIINPTNVRGPYVGLGYKFNDALKFTLRADFLEGARNRAGIGSLNITDKLTRFKAGAEYMISKRLTTSVDWEALLPSVAGGGPVVFRPIQQFITVGAGLNVAANTTLKMAYQIISLSNYGGAGVSGFAGGVGGGGTNSNASVFTTQIAVKF